MNQKKSGFTLIELMVSITIGAIVITSALSVYASFVETKLQIDIARQMQKEVNFALARVTDRVRNCSILATSNNTSLLLDCGSDSKPIFVLSAVTENSSGSFTMNGENLISQKKFMIESDSEFKVTHNSADQQGKVQIFLNVKSKQDSKVSQSIRTTISSRQY